jgi:putative phosphoesterase
MPRGARRLPDRCIELMAAADAVIHAGDFVAAAVLEEIESLGPPVHAVYGNVDEPDLRQRLPATLEVELGGLCVAIVHDAGPRAGRAERLRSRFPEAHCAIFGHTHSPEHSTLGSFHAFNPGSPTERRRARNRSMGVLEVRGGKPRFRHVPL